MNPITEVVLSNLRMACNGVQHHITELDVQLQEKRERVEFLESEAKKSELQLTQTIAAYEKQLDALRRTLNEAAESLYVTQRERNALSARNKELEQRVNGQVNLHNAASRALHSEVVAREQLRQECTTLKTERSELQNRAQTLEALLSQRDAEIQNLKRQSQPTEHKFPSVGQICWDMARELNRPEYAAFRKLMPEAARSCIEVLRPSARIAPLIAYLCDLQNDVHPFFLSNAEKCLLCGHELKHSTHVPLVSYYPNA